MTFWTVVTYLYNSLLVIFIAIHLFVGSILSFGIGIYVGIYFTQNYNVPRVDEPYKLWEGFLNLIEQYRKVPPSSSLTNNKEPTKGMQEGK